MLDCGVEVGSLRDEVSLSNHGGKGSLNIQPTEYNEGRPIKALRWPSLAETRRNSVRWHANRTPKALL